MAERVWEAAGPTVQRMLRDNPEYGLVLTGHSLGGGAACLLNILCHTNKRKFVDGRNVRCFSYAAPPTFTPLDLAPAAVRSCTNFIHERDVVPFLSVDSVRQFFRDIRALQYVNMGWRQRIACVTGHSEPDEALLKAIRHANRKRLIPKKGAPMLVIPAGRNLWIREKKNRQQGRERYRFPFGSTDDDDGGDGTVTERGGSSSSDAVVYGAKNCDSRKLAELGIQIDINMLPDHFPSRYEHALNHLAEDGVGENGF